MTSINTNSSAMTALQSLQMTNKDLATTQSRISTGFRVSTASDNAAYWSIATTMRSDNKANSVVNDALGLGAGKVDTAYSGMEKAIESVNQIKEKLTAAFGASDADKAKIQTEIDAIQDHLISSTKGATFSGANWLSVDSSTANGHAAAGTFDDVTIVSAFTRAADGSVSIQTIDVAVNDVKLFDAAGTTAETRGILEGLRLGTSGARDDTATAGVAGTVAAADGYAVSTLTVIDFTDEQIEQMISIVDTAITEMTDAATKLGAAKNRIDLQKEFTASLMDSIDRGVGQLVDADMNKESTRLQALQTQQQLGIQALSIANSNTQSILSLFRG